MLLKGPVKRSAERARKPLYTIFHQLGLKITAEVNNQIVNFQDVTFNLQEEKYSAYRKPNKLLTDNITTTINRTLLYRQSVKPNL